MDAWDKMREIPTYCTVDIDCLDPSVAPGTGTPEVCGLQITQVLNIIRNLATVKLVGADIVEV